MTHLRRQQNLAKWDIPGANYSGITYISDNRYAVINDKEKGEGFYVFSITIDSLKGKITNVCLLSRPLMPEAGSKSRKCPKTDVEDVAFVPPLQTLFLADEDSQRIVEYSLNGRPTGRELLVPQSLSVGSIYLNYGFESLTYSSRDNLLWTVTEHTLRNDGKRSGPANRQGCLLRLQSFSPQTCKPVSTHLYKTDTPTAKKQGRFYVFGVSAIAALDDGSLLLMERELNVSKKKLGSWGNVKIYRVDLQKLTPEGYLQKELIATFKNKLNLVKRSIANYEGMCVGPRLADGRQTIILLSDSQNNYGNRLFRLKDQIRLLTL